MCICVWQDAKNSRREELLPRSRVDPQKADDDAGALSSSLTDRQVGRNRAPRSTDNGASSPSRQAGRTQRSQAGKKTYALLPEGTL